MAQPYVISLISRAAPRRIGTILGLYLALNGVLFVAGIPVSTREPPHHALTAPPPRALDLPNQHSDLMGFLGEFDGQLSIVGPRETILAFYPYSLGAYEDLEDWLDSGSCFPNPRLAVVFFGPEEDSGSASREQEWNDAVTRKCPDAERVGFARSVVYLVGERSSRNTAENGLR
jgi:hypothetical protein